MQQNAKRLQPLWHGKTHFHSPPPSERDKKRFTACKSKGEGPRQLQKISVRMCDQIELITLTCKRQRDGKEAPPGDGEVGGGPHAAPNATTGGLIGLDPYSFLKLWRPQPPLDL